jgi:glycosyltransferase involved in cell wall biosynthesis
MRILITGTTGNSLPPPYAGIPKLILLSAKLWKAHGHDVALTFTYKPKEPDDLGANATYFFEYLNRPNKFTKITFLARYFLRNPVLYCSLLREYHKICPHFTREMVLYSAYGVYLDTVFEKWKPDIILGEAVLIKSFMAAAIAKRRNVRVVFDVYAEVRDLSMGENRHLNEDQRKAYWVSFLNMADLIVGLDNCSVEMKAYVPPEKLKVFIDTADTQFFSQEISETKTELRDHFKLPRDIFLAGAVGSFELRKGHDHLIKAVGMLAKKGHNVGIVICGSLGAFAKWKAIAKEEGVEDRCYFFSSISEKDLARLHRAIDVYTNLSNTQRMCGLDFALLEAMGSGLPLVLYDNGALYKAVPGEENGFLVSMNEIPAVADAILKLYKMTPEERAEMGKKSSVVAAKFDIRITTDIKLGWFKEIVNNYKK